MTDKEVMEALALKQSQVIHSIKDIDCPRDAINPGIYFGFVRGWRACRNVGTTSKAVDHARFVYPDDIYYITCMSNRYARKELALLSREEVAKIKNELIEEGRRLHEDKF